MKMPTTPQLWLLWTRSENINVVVRAATAAAIGTLSVMEAHAAISILRLSPDGPVVVPVSLISLDAGHKVQATLMMELRKRGYVTPAARIRGTKCTAWRATKRGLAEFAAVQARLEALIARARPLEAANALLNLPRR
jgi:hypothetical protein